MPVLKKRRLQSALVGKCGADEDRGRDHAWYTFHVEDGVYATTKISHGGGGNDIDRGGVARIARQRGLTQNELGDLVSCRMTAAAFHLHLVTNGPFTGNLR